MDVATLGFIRSFIVKETFAGNILSLPSYVITTSELDDTSILTAPLLLVFVLNALPFIVYFILAFAIGFWFSSTRTAETVPEPETVSCLNSLETAVPSTIIFA